MPLAQLPPQLQQYYEMIAAQQAAIQLQQQQYYEAIAAQQAAQQQQYYEAIAAQQAAIQLQQQQYYEAVAAQQAAAQAAQQQTAAQLQQQQYYEAIAAQQAAFLANVQAAQAAQAVIDKAAADAAAAAEAAELAAAQPAQTFAEFVARDTNLDLTTNLYPWYIVQGVGYMNSRDMFLRVTAPYASRPGAKSIDEIAWEYARDVQNKIPAGVRFDGKNWVLSDEARLEATQIEDDYIQILFRYFNQSALRDVNPGAVYAGSELQRNALASDPISRAWSAYMWQKNLDTGWAKYFPTVVKSALFAGAAVVTGGLIGLALAPAAVAAEATVLTAAEAAAAAETAAAAEAAGAASAATKVGFAAAKAVVQQISPEAAAILSIASLGYGALSNIMSLEEAGMIASELPAGETGMWDFDVPYETYGFDPYTFDATSDVLAASELSPSFIDYMPYETYGFDPYTIDPTADIYASLPDVGFPAMETYGFDPYTADPTAEVFASLPEVQSLSFQFPDVSIKDVLGYVSAGMKIANAFQTADAQVQYARALSPTRALAPAAQPKAPTIRQTRDPITGKIVTLKQNPTTGQWEPFESPSLIPGLPNWALFAGAAAGIFLLAAPQRRNRGS